MIAVRRIMTRSRTTLAKTVCKTPARMKTTTMIQRVMEISSKDLGLSDNNGFGKAAVFTEDLDKDGVPDMAIGAQYAAGNPRTGAVIIVSGKTGKELGRIKGPEPGSRFGTAFASIGANLLAVGEPGPGES